LLSTLGGKPRPLTQAGDKDAQPAWSPRGDLIAFVAKREQEGHKDEASQLYLIPPDGGEAHRAAQVATGVDAFRWMPDGRGLLFVSWVWPDTKGSKAQAKRLAEFKKRKESAYVTSEAQYRFWDHQLPMGREPHLHLLELGRGDRPGKVRDLFEGLPYALTRAEPDARCFDVSPDGRRVVFAFDPAAEKRIENCYALAEMELRTGRVRVLARDEGWDFQSPAYSPDGDRIAFTASHQARKHTAPAQLAVWERESGAWELLSGEWDHEVHAPLHWEDDGQAVLLTA
jgi:dipeptidyl aminopeptidase/acylaminoacyl peptidase